MNRISLTIVTHDHSLMIQAHTQYRNKKSHNIMEIPYQYMLSEHADEIVTKTFPAISLVLWFPNNTSYVCKDKELLGNIFI